MSKRLMLLVGLAAATAAFGSVMDEAKFWWKFDQGGADGAVVQTSEIHDCRDASVGVASRTSGPSGGPIWTNTTVRLPYRGQVVQSSALNIQVITNTSSQIRPSMVDFGNGYVNSDTLTFFARICPGDTLNDGVNYVGTDERFIFNDNFVWGSAKSNSYGYLLGLARRNATSYYPKIFIGQLQDTFSGIVLETGKWYDLAFSVSMVTNMTSTTHTDITTNDVTGVTTTNVTTSVTTSIVQRALCVAAGENGLFYQTQDNAYQRQVPFSGTTGRIGGQQFVSSWVTSVGGNQVNAKDYNGLIHEMALWDRAMNLGEILNVFGRPEAPEGGDVFTDVFRWWKFDRDLDGDGKVSANELRDVRKWGTAAAPAAGNPEVEYVTDGGPLTWQNMSVHKPARGETVAADCLLMEPQYRENADTSFEVWSPHVRFKDSTVVGDATFMARICITKPYDYYPGAKNCYLFQDSFSYGSSTTTMGGYLVGIATVGSSTTNFYPLIYGGRNVVTVSSLVITTNTWYDIAYTISTQTNGLDRLTVTVADAKHGIRQWSGTMPTSQAQKTGTVLALNGENDFRDWTVYRKADGTIPNVNALKIFTGAINQIAIWKRALSTDEIAAAFGYPRAAFGVGAKDGTAAEFATAAEGSYDYTVSDTWHDMAGTLDATHRTLTLRFTPPPNWNGMDQGFHLVVGDVTGSDAQVSLAVNGARFGSKAVATGDDVWWIVKGGAVHAGENVATLTLGGTGSLAIDKLEMLGSWALVSGGTGGEFSHEGNPQGKDFYVGDRNMTHVTRAVVSDRPSNRLHFWLPAELAENYPFEFTFRTHANANGTAAFKIFINGEELFDAPNGLVNQERTFEFAPGALRAGWNVIEPHYQTGGGAWAQWIRYTLKMIGPDFGTILMVR